MDFRIGDVQVSAFGSRAHLEEKAIATVKILQRYTCFYLYICSKCLELDVSAQFSEEMVSQLLDERFPSCGSVGCWFWNKGYTGNVLSKSFICVCNCFCFTETCVFFFAVWFQDVY